MIETCWWVIHSWYARGVRFQSIWWVLSFFRGFITFKKVVGFLFRSDCLGKTFSVNKASIHHIITPKTLVFISSHGLIWSRHIIFIFVLFFNRVLHSNKNPLSLDYIHTITVLALHPAMFGWVWLFLLFRFATRFFKSTFLCIIACHWCNDRCLISL